MPCVAGNSRTNKVGGTQPKEWSTCKGTRYQGLGGNAYGGRPQTQQPPVPAALILASAYPLSQDPSDISSLTKKTLSWRKRLSGLAATPPKCDEKSWGPPPELAKTSRPLLHRTFGGSPSSLKAQQEPKRASRPRQMPSSHPAMVDNNAPLMAGSALDPP